MVSDTEVSTEQSGALEFLHVGKKKALTDINSHLLNVHSNQIKDVSTGSVVHFSSGDTNSGHLH